MIPWILLDSARVPGRGGELGLYQCGDELTIRIIGEVGLMNSHQHDSEDALAELTCRRLQDTIDPRILIGGLGMGFTLSSALRNIGELARVEVAELVSAVVKWNRGVIGEHSGHPLKDPRVCVREVDVADIIRAERRAFDAIILDVDNGPDGLTRKSNDWLYSLDGLVESYEALRPGGLLSVWSAGPEEKFTSRLLKVGFSVEQMHVRVRNAKGTTDVIWFARREE